MQGLKSKLTNQVHLLEVEEENRTMSKTVFSHPAGEVWDLAASPSGERWGRGISFIRSYVEPLIIVISENEIYTCTFHCPVFLSELTTHLGELVP